MVSDTPEGAAAPERAMKPWFKSLRFWLSTLTLVLVFAIVWAAWPNVVEAFSHLREVNPWILALLVPIQLLSWAFTGEVLFSYLRSRGELKGMHPFTAMRMSLEFNFANHMLPSGGAAGLTYATWKLGTLGVSASRGTLAQLVRFGVTFVSFSILLAIAAVWLWFSGHGTTQVIWIAAIVGSATLLITLLGVIVLPREKLQLKLARGLARFASFFTRLFGKPPVSPVPLEKFFGGMAAEAKIVGQDPKSLIAPFLWSFAVNILDASLYWIALAAFGFYGDPAVVFVAYGIATIASLVIPTPNGVGGYELSMIGTMTSGGFPLTLTTAAVVLARVLLMLMTIVFGWVFYQASISRAGAPKLREASTGKIQLP